MEAADVLYGVTMGGDGAGEVVSRRSRARTPRRSPPSARQPGRLAPATRSSRPGICSRARTVVTRDRLSSREIVTTSTAFARRRCSSGRRCFLPWLRRGGRRGLLRARDRLRGRASPLAVAVAGSTPTSTSTRGRERLLGTSRSCSASGMDCLAAEQPRCGKRSGRGRDRRLQRDGDPDLAAARSGVSSFNVMVRLGGPERASGRRTSTMRATTRARSRSETSTSTGTLISSSSTATRTTSRCCSAPPAAPSGRRRASPRATPIAVALADSTATVTSISPCRTSTPAWVRIGAARRRRGHVRRAQPSTRTFRRRSRPHFNGDGDPDLAFGSFRRNRWRLLSAVRDSLAGHLGADHRRRADRLRSATSTATAARHRQRRDLRRRGAVLLGGGDGASTSTRTLSTASGGRPSPLVTSTATETSIPPSRARTSSPCC